MGNERNSVPGGGKAGKKPPDKPNPAQPYPKITGSTGSGQVKLIYSRSGATGGPSTSSRKHKASEEGPALDANSLKRIKQELRSTSALTAAQPESPNSSIMSVESRDAEEEVEALPGAIFGTATIKSETGDITSVSMVKIVRDLDKVLSHKFEVSFNRNKGVHVKLYSRMDLEALTKIKNICGHDISVQTNSRYMTNSNSETSRSATHSGARTISWGKFFSHDLFNCTDEEILEVLQAENQNILSATRLYRTNNGEKVPSKLIKVKFDAPTIPEKILCLYRAYDVKLYIPPPQKCRKCHRFGHWTDDCNNTWACHKCGKNHNKDDICSAALRCVACGQGHSSLDPKCPRFLKEKEIVEISYEQNVSFPQARTLLTSGTRSYASLLKGNNGPTGAQAVSPTVGSDAGAVAGNSTNNDSDGADDDSSGSAGAIPPPQVPATPKTSVTTTGTETPEDIETAITEAVSNNTDKIITPNQPSKAVYIDTDLHQNFAEMAKTTKTVLTKIDALPSTDPSIQILKESLQKIIQSFLVNMGQLATQVQNG